MSYDIEASGSSTITQPLINGANKGRSAEEIKELLQKCTDNNLRLEKYNQSLDNGKSQAKKNRVEIHNLINESMFLIQRSKDLLRAYDGPDKPVYGRKMNSVAEKLEETIKEIKEKESSDLEQIRKSFARMSIVETPEEREIEKKELKMKLDSNLKILEEAEYMDGIIDERQKDIDNISKIMGDVREIAKDFLLEVNTQGDKIVDVERKMENVYHNTTAANKELKQASKRSRKNGCCLLIVAIVILACVGGLIAVLFGTNVL